MALILNAPLIIWAIVELGYKLVVKTIFAIILTSISIDVIAMFIPPYQGDQMLVAIFAGVTEGAGLALIFIRGERPVMDDKYPIQKHPNYRLTADGGKPPYQKKFDIPSYEQNDLPHEINIENLEILEETEHEEEIHSEPHRPDAQGKTALLRRCADLRAGLRRLYARFRRR